jgi:branched-chain amino acid transport system permease protein
LFLINLIAVVGLGIFSGNSGILSFGHVAFIGLGAYISGILTLPLATKASALPHLPAFLASIEWGLPAALLATVICVGLFGALIGVPIVRMGGAAAVIATLGLLLIVHGIIIGASDFTRGSNAFPRRRQEDRHLGRARDRRADHPAGALVPRLAARRAAARQPRG